MEACPDKNKVSICLSLEKIKDIFDSLDIGVHIMDADGITILYNKACEEIEGISEEWIVGKDMNKLVYDGVYSESVALEAIVKGETVAKTQKVNGRHIFSTAVPIYENKQLINIVVSVMDMTSFENLKTQFNELKNVNMRIQKELNILNAKDGKKDSIITKSEKIEGIKTLALRIANVDSTVLIEGESGVGKGLFSKYIHENSNRKNEPFIKVDCSSLPEGLIESELFGYEEGAFTGARKDGKVGLIQLANKGTLFLDEIGELPLNLQVKLLNVIQDKVFQKVGGTKNISIDTRIIAATNRDLYAMVEEGTFREDLYYRLKVIPIRIPSLRERKMDIVPLTNFFLKKLNEHYNYEKVISSGAMKLLINYDWPGNVRELQNEVERLVVTSEFEIITEEDVLDGDIGKARTMEVDENMLFKENVYKYEKILLEDYIYRVNDIHELSEKTGLEASTLRKKAKKLGIDLKFQKRKKS
ncbi:PAS domain S-box-containing protein [Tissierella praeacuta DSM 18095]|uniref:PAS domain S-box-containing protein n=1 Tax=Tissierella praeacuta DSM 18095 TaxID=1123404 RepID=A0A1M4YWZ5_9FIRM|nr:sigma 54-interacting transcriptional regulator [Tissierella praeacuta]SHF10077.1 PAS domain S-box-containing protein [Tissierella praeacuta DSM 18095]SUP00692.1 Transcriptional regulatory protein ZraR [Tissierella praeacuta]